MPNNRPVKAFQNTPILGAVEVDEERRRNFQMCAVYAMHYRDRVKKKRKAVLCSKASL
jgi:hypothetical protein